MTLAVLSSELPLVCRPCVPEKTGPDNVPGKITEIGLVIGKDPVTDINMKTGMTL